MLTMFIILGLILFFAGAVWTIAALLFIAKIIAIIAVVYLVGKYIFELVF